MNNLTRDEARARAALVGSPSYDLRLDLTRGDKVFGCEARIAFEVTRPGGETFLDLLAESVTAVELNGRDLGPEALADGRVRLPDLAERNEVRIVSEQTYTNTGIGLHFFRDPVDDAVYLHTQFEPFDAHRVYPCFDQPDVKGRFRFTVVAPAGWEVVSNMPCASRPEAGAAGVWVFDETPLLPTYVTAIVAGPYEVVRDRHRDIDLGLYVRKSLRQYLDSDEVFDLTKRGFDFFEDVFGYRYPFGKYDQLFVPEFNFGAMENAGCVTFSETYVFRSKVTDALRERRADTILHEMAHMWFGDLVTMRWWDDLWLNESFASFMSVLAQVRATRFTNAWVTFGTDWKVWAYKQDQLPSTHPVATDMPDTTSVRTNFDGITYAKGASVLRQLVAWVGEEAFIDGLKVYFRRHEYANTELRDFLAVLEEASGRELDGWAKEWLQTSGTNALRADFDADGDAYASFAIVQEAAAEHPTLRRHRVAVGLYDRTGDGIVRRRRVELDVAGERTDVPELMGEKVPDLLLVNDDDLTFAKIRLDPRSFETLRAHLADLRDPLGRAMCWAASWDMMRDGELPAGHLVDLIANNIAGETDVGVVQTLLADCSAAILVYGDPSHRLPRLNRLAEAALAAARAADPGGDFQLAWARSFIAAARSDEHLGIVRGLLDSGEAIPGLAVDFDLRWHAVVALAARGLIDEAGVDAELERDPTDAGRRQAAAARAARPAAGAKADAWELVVGDASLSLATAKATIAGFQRPDQEELLRPYVEPYFAALPAIWGARDTEAAIVLANGLYPVNVPSEELLAITDEYLSRDDGPGPVRRMVLEGRDQVRRTLRARQVDASS